MVVNKSFAAIVQFSEHLFREMNFDPFIQKNRFLLPYVMLLNHGLAIYLYHIAHPWQRQNDQRR